MKKPLMILAVLLLTMAFSVPAFADETPNVQNALESSIIANEKTDLTTALSEVKEDAVKKNERKAFKEKFSGLFEELNQLRTECKALWEQLKSLNQSIKGDWQAFKATLEDMEKEEKAQAIAELKAKVEPLRAQAKAIRGEIQAIRETKKAEWVKFREAVQVQDEGSAEAALTNIIALKKQIIEKQKSLILTKQSILDSI